MELNHHGAPDDIAEKGQRVGGHEFSPPHATAFVGGGKELL